MDNLPHRATAQAARITSASDAILLPNSHSSIFPSRPSMHPSLSCSLSSFRLHHRSFLSFSSKLPNSSSLCFATNPGSPPESDPSSEKHSIVTSDVEATFSKVQDRMQIFFAVLFWMSLFFWNCAWDGKNDDGPNKKTRFRR